MKKILFILVASLLVGSCKNSSTQDHSSVKMADLRDSFSYAFGTFVGGEMLKSQKIDDLNWDVFLAALQYSVKFGNDSGLLLKDSVISRVIDTYVDQKMFTEKKLSNSDFILKSEKAGYKTTEGGLMYKKIADGNGKKPNITDTVHVTFTGSFDDGYVFLSNEGEEPMKTSLNSTWFLGFRLAILEMDEKSTYEFIIPPDLAFGRMGKKDPVTGRTMIPPYQILKYRITLDRIQDPFN